MRDYWDVIFDAYLRLEKEYVRTLYINKHTPDKFERVATANKMQKLIIQLDTIESLMDEIRMEKLHD